MSSPPASLMWIIASRFLSTPPYENPESARNACLKKAIIILLSSDPDPDPEADPNPEPEPDSDPDDKGPRQEVCFSLVGFYKVCARSRGHVPLVIDLVVCCPEHRIPTID